ncbi:MAG: endo-1,4-beta-xylanase, partial [Firmicutes bacterium]|nr:endo-1,4-beta-xylanase [Bacillota bacterium]
MGVEMKSLVETYKDHFPIGAAVTPEVLATHGDLLVKHFNSLTPENEMKFISVHPEEDVYTFERADLLVEFARKNHMKIRGHTLIWHNQTPDWVFFDKNGSYVTKEVLLMRMKEHIYNVI